MPEAGWYTDVDDPLKARWHDGTRWTDHRVVMADHVGPPPPPRSTIQPFPAFDVPALPPGPTAEQVAAAKKALRPWYRKRITFLLVPIAMVAFAVGVHLTKNGSGGSTTFTSPASLAVALGSAGVECSDFTSDDFTSTTTGFSLGAEYRSASGECTHAGKRLKLNIFADSRHLNAYMAEGGGLGCIVAKAFGVTEFNASYGSTWEVTYTDNLDLDVPRQVASALHGKTYHKVCSTP